MQMLMNNIIFKIQTKLIHILGGYTKQEYKIPSLKVHQDAFDKGYSLGIKHGFQSLADSLVKETDIINGCSKQEWIDRIYSKIIEAYEQYI